MLSNIIQDSLFFSFSTILILFAMGVIFFKKSVHSALSLVVCFFAAASLWLLLTAEFLGLMLILVYVGAIMTLFLFIIMTVYTGHTDHQDNKNKFYYLRLSIGLLMIAVFISLLIYAVYHTSIFSPIFTQQASVNTVLIGNVLYTRYLLPFEVTGVILLVAMIAVISLTLADVTQQKRKQQNVSEQIKVKKQDRIKLIN